MLRLNCFIEVEEQNRDQVIADAIALTEASVQQHGCIAYDIFTSATRPNVLLICETWSNQETLDAHVASEEYKKYAGNMHSLARMKLEKFEF